MSAPLSKERLDAIRAREAAATPGPWCTDGAEIYQGDSEGVPHLAKWIGETCRADEGDGGKADAAFVAAARSDVPALLAEVDQLRLSPHERLILRFALEMADDAIASNPADFTDEDQAAMDKLRAMATGPVVAYRNPWRPGVLLCREHGEGWAGLKPLAAEDLPDGGTCTYGDPADVCGRDVLIGADTEGGESR